MERFWQSLIAALAGNAIYFSTARFLPERAQHQLYQVDWGVAETPGFVWPVTGCCG